MVYTRYIPCIYHTYCVLPCNCSVVPSTFSLAAAAVMDLAVLELEGSGRLLRRTDSDRYSSSVCFDNLDMNLSNTDCVLGYQNQPHRVDLARYPLCHERAARLGDKCHKTLKTRGTSNISMYTQGIYMVYTWYIHGIYHVYQRHVVS